MKKVRVWRICQKKYRNTAFTGEGVKLYGGRFNHEGTPAVYTAGSLSLAILEMLVQTNDRSLFEGCVFFQAEIPSQLIFEPGKDQLPEGWNRVPYGRISRDFGEKWITSARRPVLKVPSVVVPVEHNFVLNPAHPDFGQIRIIESKEEVPDRRLWDWV